MSTPAWSQERAAVLAAAQEMARRGLVVGSSGNVSMRIPDSRRHLLAITPSGRLYASMEPQDIVVVDFDGSTAAGELAPSTELPTHAAIYRAFPDTHAIIHTHSVYATVAAVAGLVIPALVDEMPLLVGGEVLVAEYALPGTPELGQHGVEALEGRSAVLLRNHGLVSVGHTLEEALSVAELVEHVAHIFVMARLLGTAHPLPPQIVEQAATLYRQRHSQPG